MTLLWAIWEMTINTIETLAFVIFLSKKLDNYKENKAKIWGGFVVLVVFLTVLNLFFMPPLLVAILLTIANVIYVLVVWGKHNDKGKCLFWGCSGNFVSFIANGIVNNIAIRKTGFPGENILSQSTFRFEMMCLYILIYTALFLALYYITRNKKKNISLSFKARWILFGFVLMGTTAAGLIAKITIILGNNQSIENDQAILLTAIVTGILFVIILFTMVLFEYLGVLYKNNLQLELNLQQQKNEAIAYQIMKENYQEIREWKHDYHNHLLVMSEHLKNQQYEQLQSYVGELNQAWGEIRQFANTGNSALDAIIYNKMLVAKEYNIPFNYQITLSKPLATSDINLCSIIGNLLDNALEASINVAEDLRNQSFVDLKIDTQKYMVLICISNFYSNTLSYKDGKIATLKQNLTEHGIGLSRVEKLLQQENGFLSLNVDKQIFTAEVLLPVMEETA